MNFLARLCGAALWRPLVVTGCLLAMGGVLRAERVDAELVLLVDTSNAVNRGDFTDMMDGFASAFESSDVINAIQTGDHGLAVTLMFFSNSSTQVVGVPWMKLEDGDDARDFAGRIRSATRPRSTNASELGPAMDYARQLIGSETGFAGNGFESDQQALTFGSETNLRVPNGNEPTVEAARDAALASGVDVISALTVGTVDAAAAQQFYEDSVIGGAPSAEVANATNYGALPATATALLARQIVGIVPEPSVFSMVLCAATMFVFRRGRR